MQKKALFQPKLRIFCTKAVKDPILLFLFGKIKLLDKGRPSVTI